ncbi:uncharacterized protein LAESUDRAFT_729065 [Laetiporus sulphureus 93-53]|uniref:RlpA-like protein double-psi beta-barrel domain-containing protein n=1 Tax=Laetiporus sulphureus 93-53 TaxID=1314785 RepID=A0A165CV79_9APHY|nr:uncharacterized protein LAESUDRAFT_729065 [Laetiporus sulphureus 93-53]KZT03488.1 hypothetical protein LAESUDRAFT_729065 [Laetiporus sulphureus 93-53]
MRSSTLLGYILASLVVPLVAAGHLNRFNLHRRHDALARNATSGLTNLAKRQSFSDARFTYYAVGLGACGQTNVPSDFIVALDSILYDASDECFKSITISYGGKSTTATIMDRCPGCPEGGLDLSEGLFEYFADTGEGVIYGEWSYAGSSPATTSSDTPTPTSTYVAPTTSSTYVPPPTTSSTSAYTPPTTSSTYTPPPTSSSSTHVDTPSTTSSSSSSSSVAEATSKAGSSAASSSVAASSSASSSGALISLAISASATLSAELSLPSSTGNSTSGDMLEQLNLALIGMAGLIAVGAEVSA